MKYVNPKIYLVGGNVTVIPFTFLGAKRLVVGFAKKTEVGFLHVFVPGKVTISKVLTFLPRELKYLKDRISAQVNRKIVQSWVYSHDETNHVVGVPFDFDISIPRRLMKDLPFLESYITVDGKYGWGGYINPEFLAIDSKLDIKDPIKASYIFNSLSNYSPVFPRNTPVDVPRDILYNFEVRYICYDYRVVDYEEISKLRCRRIHVILADRESSEILTNSFDDSRYNFIGGSREEFDKDIIDSVIRECREETRFIVLERNSLSTLARFYYCAELEHVVVTMYSRGFRKIAELFSRDGHKGRRENYGPKTIHIDDFVASDPGCYGPNSIPFFRWFKNNSELEITR